MNEEIDVSGCKYYENGFCCEFPDFRTICEQNDTCDYKQFKFLKQTKNELWQENAKLKQSLKKIKSIIDNDFINRYMELSFNEYDAILEQIEKICEVLKDE